MHVQQDSSRVWNVALQISNLNSMYSVYCELGMLKTFGHIIKTNRCVKVLSFIIFFSNPMCLTSKLCSPGA